MQVGEDGSDGGAHVAEPNDFLCRDELQDAFEERCGYVAGSIDLSVADYGLGGWILQYVLGEADGETAGPRVEVDDFACTEEFLDPLGTVLFLVLHSMREA